MAGWDTIPHGVVPTVDYSPDCELEDFIRTVLNQNRDYIGESRDGVESFTQLLMKLTNLLGHRPRLGGSRAAFRVSNTEVIKVAYTESGRFQNLLESAVAKKDWSTVKDLWPNHSMGAPWEFVEDILRKNDYFFPVAHTVVSSRYTDILNGVGLSADHIVSQEALTPVQFIMETNIPTKQKAFWSLMNNYLDVVQLGIRESTGEVLAYDF